MRTELVLPMKSVWPSGSAAATDFAPMIPPAPPVRFSTITGCPSAAAILSEMSRRIWSGGATRRRRHDKFDGPIRIGLRALKDHYARCDQDDGQKGGKPDSQTSHDPPPTDRSERV